MKNTEVSMLDMNHSVYMRVSTYILSFNHNRNPFAIADLLFLCGMVTTQ